MSNKKGCGCGCFGTILLLAVVAAVAVFLWMNRLGLAEWLYPRDHEDVVTEQCDRYGLDKWLVMAVIRQESHYDDNAESGAGATGLMQLMPSTAEWAIQQAGFAMTTEQALTDPLCNIAVGVWYLDWLEQHHYPGNMVCVVAAYNAGAGTVDGWLNDGDWDGALSTAENIPYGETRRYVQDVFRSYRIYQQLYEE